MHNGTHNSMRARTHGCVRHSTSHTPLPIRDAAQWHVSGDGDGAGVRPRQSPRSNLHWQLLHGYGLDWRDGRSATVA